MEPTGRREGQPDAVAEGRRIYIGNLLYAVKPDEIEQALAASGFGEYAQIHISVDPVSGRNPGYCFVDFHERATAESALASLSATVGGRPLKVGPCQPKQQRNGGAGRWNRGDGGDRQDRQDRPAAFQRWGDWKRPDAEGGARVGPPPGEGAAEQGPRAALNHFDRVFERREGERLYIGGLGKMIDQDQNYEEMMELLAGFQPKAIGKRITAHESMWTKPGNHNYCFVDFETAQEAGEALNALNGKPYKGGSLNVSIARSHPERLKQRETGARYAPRETAGDSAESGAVSRPRAIESSNWRRRDN